MLHSLTGFKKGNPYKFSPIERDRLLPIMPTAFGPDDGDGDGDDDGDDDGDGDDDEKLIRGNWNFQVMMPDKTFARIHYYSCRSGFREAHLHKTILQTEVIIGGFENVLGYICENGSHPLTTRLNQIDYRSEGSANFVETNRVEYFAGDVFTHPTGQYHYLDKMIDGTVTLTKWKEDPRFLPPVEKGVVGDFHYMLNRPSYEIELQVLNYLYSKGVVI